MRNLARLAAITLTFMVALLIVANLAPAATAADRPTVSNPGVEPGPPRSWADICPDVSPSHLRSFLKGCRAHGWIITDRVTVSPRGFITSMTERKMDECVAEDGSARADRGGCLWDGRHSGNHRGRSYLAVQDHGNEAMVRLPHRRVHSILF